MQNPWKSQSKVNPQREQGHREIENNIWQTLMKQRLSGIEWDVIAVVIDKTYGYGKTCDRVSYGQLEKMTGRARRRLIIAVKRLIERRILLVSKTTLVNEVMLNKYYDTWIQPTSVENDTRCKGQTSDQNDTKVVSKTTPKLVTKTTPTKERKKLTKEITPVPGRYFPSKSEVNMVERYCLTLSTYFKKNFWPWVQKCINKKYRPDAIIYALKELSEHTKTTEDPWPYLDHIVWKQHQNLNEAEGIATHEARKEEGLRFGDLDWMKNLKKGRDG